MDIKAFPKKLQHIRKMRGMSLRDLCAKMGGLVSVQTLSNYEKGTSFPEGNIMWVLLEALDTKIDALFQTYQIDWENVDFRYRKRKTMSKGLSVQLDEKIKDYAERYVDIENILSVEPDDSILSLCDDITVSSRQDARLVAGTIREKKGLAGGPIVSIFDFVEAMGVKVIGIDVEEKFDGVSFVTGKHTFIVYNRLQTNKERIRFTIAHELGHLLLNISDDIEDSEEEKLCNSFASEFLLPSANLQKILGSKRGGIYLNELKRIQNIYGISVDAIMYACAELGIISEHRLQQYHIRKNASQELKDEIDSSLYSKEVPNDRFEVLVCRALACGVITQAKAASLLNITVDVLNDKMKAL